MSQEESVSLPTIHIEMPQSEAYEKLSAYQAGVLKLTEDEVGTLSYVVRKYKPVITKNMPLWQIVDTLVATESGMFEVTEKEHEILGELIRREVDSGVDFVDQIEARIEKHKNYAKKHTSYAKTLENQLGRYVSYVKNVMIKGQFELLSGEEKQIKLSNPPGALEIEGSPTEEDFKMMPDFVTRTIEYKWNKNAIKKAINEGVYPLGNAEIVKNRQPKFDIKKGAR